MIEKISLLPYVFIGGGLGASLRWFLNLLSGSLSLPLWQATLVANGLGMFIYFLSVKLMWNDPQWNSAFLRIGLLGSLTTFSTWSFEIVTHIQSGQWGRAALIFILNILAGVLIAVGIFR